MASVAINEEKFDALMGKALTDIGGAMSLLLAYVGDRLDLYRTLERHGPGTSTEIAAAAGLDERYVREWLSGAEPPPAIWSTTRPASASPLSPEAALVYAAEGDPRCLQGFFQAVKSAFDDEEKSTAAFRAGVRSVLGRPLALLLPRHRPLLPPRLCGEPGRAVDPGADRRPGEAGGGREGRRHRLRPRLLDAADGRSLPELAFHRLRFPPALDRLGDREDGRVRA